MKEMDECAGSGTSGLEGELVCEGEPRWRALKGRVDVVVDNDAFQNS